MNNWTNAVTLVSITPGTDSAGFKTETLTKLEHVPATFKSITRAEEEHAKTMGYTANLSVEILKSNYSNQSLLIDEDTGKKYEIKRTYDITPEKVELTCSDLSRKTNG